MREIRSKYHPESHLISSSFGKISSTEKPIVWFYEFGKFLAYDSLGLKRNGADSFLKENLNPMQLLFYSSRDDQNKKRLEAAVHKVAPESQIELFKRLADLRERLRRPIEPDSLAVLSASNREELQQMQLLRGLLTEIYVVLVIPDRKKSTIRLAHLLLARFLSQKESDFKDLKIVLDKIYQKSHKFRGIGNTFFALRDFPSH